MPGKRMSSSSEDEESPEELSYPSEWSDDGKRCTDQQESDQDKDAEKYKHDKEAAELTVKVTARGRRRKRKREDRTSDQEEADQDEDAEKHGHDRGEPMKVMSRGRTSRRKRKREDKTSSDQEETGQEEEGRTSQSNLEKHKRDKEVTPRGKGERKEKRKKLGSVRGDESSETVAGIIYLSRIPPFMKPHRVKHLLSQYGSVGRVYLKPEG